MVSLHRHAGIYMKWLPVGGCMLHLYIVAPYCGCINGFIFPYHNKPYTNPQPYSVTVIPDNIKIFSIWVMTMLPSTSLVTTVSYKIFEYNLKLSFYCHSRYFFLDCDKRNSIELWERVMKDPITSIFSEADFNPTSFKILNVVSYTSWNSCLFDTSISRNKYFSVINFGLH